MKVFTHLFTHFEQNQPYLQGKELNELVQILFILRTQATLHVVMTFQTKQHTIVVICYFLYVKYVVM